MRSIGHKPDANMKRRGWCIVPRGIPAMKNEPKAIVLAMNSHMSCHAYGPFATERDATIWRDAQDADPANSEWSYTVISLLRARIYLSRSTGARRVD